MKFSGRSGFTIIEVMLVLAVGSSLLLIGLVGRGQIREQTQFTDGVERLASSLKKHQAEATSSVGRESAITGCNSGIGKNKDCINLGVLVDFQDSDITDGAYRYQVWQIVADRKNNTSGDDFVTTVRARNPRLLNRQVITPSWGLTARSSAGGVSQKIAFIRHSGNGEVENIVLDSSVLTDSSNPGWLDSGDKNKTVSLDVYDEACNYAIITINPSGKAGKITSEIQPDRLSPC